MRLCCLGHQSQQGCTGSALPSCLTHMDPALLQAGLRPTAAAASSHSQPGAWLQGMHAALRGCNALDLSQLTVGLAGMFSERSKGQQPPLKLLEAVEAHAVALLTSFSPMVGPGRWADA